MSLYLLDRRTVVLKPVDGVAIDLRAVLTDIY